MFQNINNNSVETKDPETIGQIYDKFAKDLYNHKQMDTKAANKIIQKANIPNFNDLLQPLDNPISTQETLAAIDHLKPTSPGIDGLSAPFTKNTKIY